MSIPESPKPRNRPLLFRWEQPASLLKGYNDVQYADMFALEGKLRLNPLEYYTTIEDENRKDAGEGQLHTIDHVGCRHGRQQLNPKFVFCMSGPHADPSFHACRFGKHVVQINDPCRFANELHTWLFSSRYWRIVSCVKCLKVTYGATEDHYSKNGDRLIYSNKPQHFSAEDEYRIVVMCNGFTGNTPYLDIDFGGAPSYVKHILHLVPEEDRGNEESPR